VKQAVRDRRQTDQNYKQLEKLGKSPVWAIVVDGPKQDCANKERRKNCEYDRNHCATRAARAVGMLCRCKGEVD
jgi:hypothetical protein